MNASKKLTQWMTGMRPPLKRSEFCRQLQLDEGYLSRMLAGKQVPSLVVAAKIEAVTFGRVRATDWITPRP